MLPEEPVYSSYYKLGNLTYKKGDGSTFVEPPCLEGIDFGCRTGVIFSPRDLTCGWDGHEHPRGTRVVIDEARQVGANLITYVLGTFQLGRFLSSTKVYYEASAPSRDDLVFAQLIHDGDWDPDPSAVHNLLKYVRDNSTMEVKFKRENVRLKDPKVAEYPLLYATGHRDFAWSAEEAAALGRYLKAGGLLLADACCGRMAFDLAFRREIAKALPGQKLVRLPADHPLYHCPLRHQAGGLHAAGAGGFWRAQCPGAGRDHPRRQVGGGLQPVRPGQRLGAVPARLQLRLERRIRVADRHERAGVGGDALRSVRISQSEMSKSKSDGRTAEIRRFVTGLRHPDPLPDGQRTFDRRDSLDVACGRQCDPAAGCRPAEVVAGLALDHCGVGVVRVAGRDDGLHAGRLLSEVLATDVGRNALGVAAADAGDHVWRGAAAAARPTQHRGRRPPRGGRVPRTGQQPD